MGYYDEITGEWVSDGYDDDWTRDDNASGTRQLSGWTVNNGVWTDPSGKPYDLSYLPSSDQSTIGNFLGKFGTTALNLFKVGGTGANKDDIDWKKVATAGGGLMALLGNRGAGSPPVGYQGGIPKYTAMREAIKQEPRKEGEPERRPGSGEQRYLSDVEYKPVAAAAGGGLMGLAKGRYLNGETDGMADKISTTIDNKQPAALSHGEFVIPADVVSHLGNGNSEAGAKRLYEMMDRIRKARTGTVKQGRQINPNKHLPA